ncbi:TauD/TfdA family dioxygenase [Shimia sp. R10_1]|uniref:TauD/TfdA family dioxygenase n=1 Tax=Shimia sp. R10_1 TaxID=2821095 RepID=UPI001ADCB930|nr:TauD/TfdA family dioxygenase [Shimia sp. R10_1]MBO9473457.1 TauD/TfdA family dioxygenase [Shimia sp. R10_1]
MTVQTPSAPVQIELADTLVRLTWDQDTVGDFPFIWLRENDPAGFHPQTQERLTDLTAIALDIKAESAEQIESHLKVSWADEQGDSLYDLAWLRAHRPGQRAADAADTGFISWRSNLSAAGIPRALAGPVMQEDAALQDWLVATRQYGLSIIEGLADSTEAGMDVAKRIGFLRETNFGVTFEVKSKPNPNNLAYTPVALPLHTDLTNQELPPGFQFLHCLANEAEGGESLFCDGYAVAEDLKTMDPDAFAALCDISIPFRFHDETTDIRARKRVITCDDNGDVIEICFNAHLADFLDIAPEQMARYYRAYQMFMAMTRDPKYVLDLKLKAGEMVVFDNRRVLHGRSAFDPNTGRRHLHGCYVDRGEFESRLRILAR